MKLSRITSVWARFFFIHNKYKMRNALTNYIDNEGLRFEINDGAVMVESDGRAYTVNFDLLSSYNKCEIYTNIIDDKYKELATEDKTYIADRVNTETVNDTTVYCFDEFITSKTYFYFTNKSMLLELFANHFESLVSTTARVNELAYDIIQDKDTQSNKAIGFCHNGCVDKNTDNSKISAKYTLPDMKEE